MTRPRILSIMACIAIVGYGCDNQAAELLTGDPAAAPLTSFSVPITTHVQDSLGQAFFVGTGANNKEFVLSWNQRGHKNFLPLAPATVVLKGIEKSTNPLYNQKIDFLTLFQEQTAFGSIIHRPVVVSAVDDKSIYLLDNITAPSNISVVVTDKLLDAQGLQTAGIVGLGSNNTFAFAAVKAQGAVDFGPVGSGIALAGTVEQKITEVVDAKQVERTVRGFGQIGTALYPVSPTDVRAVPLDYTSNVAKIVSDLVSMSVSDMCWSNDLQTFYIALNVTGGAGAGDGARSIVRGRFDSVQIVHDGVPATRLGFVLEPLVADAVFVPGDTDAIVGAIDADVQVSAHKIRVMRTSTRLNYLVVQGSVGTPAATQQVVYALPLVLTDDSLSANGTLAAKDAVPEDTFFGQRTDFLYQRLLRKRATTNADVLKTTDAAAQVGGGVLPAGPISDIVVESDAVFISVGVADPNQLPGTFVSTALFDELGRIKGWTEWQRVGGSIDQAFGMVFDPQLGDIISLEGNNAATVNTVMRTIWSTGDVSSPLQEVSTIVGGAFPLADGGVQGLSDYPVNTPTFNGVSWIITTGLRKIAIIETGITAGGTFIPNSGNFTKDLITITDGTIPANLPQPGTMPRVIVMSGGALDQLGAITCAEIAASTAIPAQGYLVVGGVNGVAVLTTPVGDGWNALGNSFNGLTQNMSFQKIGSYNLVRKLISSQGYLYVLSDSGLDRIDIAASNFATGTLVSVRLASRQNIPGVPGSDEFLGSFLDMLISGKLALLATSAGLLRSGNGVDIADPALAGVDDALWTPVLLPQSLLPISYLVPLSHDGLETGFAAQAGGTVYVISGDIGNNRARLSRVSIKPAGLGDTVDNTTVLPLNDLFIKNSRSYFANLNGFRNIFSTDGSIRFMTVDKDLKAPTSVQVLPPNLATGETLLAPASTPLPVNSKFTSELVRLMRSSASGSWLIGGNFGLFLNE